MAPPGTVVLQIFRLCGMSDAPWSNGCCACCAFPAAKSRPPRNIHQLYVDQGHAASTYSADNPISVTIDSGDVVSMQCWDSSEHDLPDPATATVEMLLNRRRQKPLGGWLECDSNLAPSHPSLEQLMCSRIPLATALAIRSAPPCSCEVQCQETH